MALIANTRSFAVFVFSRILSNVAGPSQRGWLPGAADLWRRVLLPGVPEGEADRWGRALAALLLVVALASLPWAHRLSLPIPWGIDPRTGVPSLLAAAGLGVFLLLRFLRERGERR